MTDSREALVRFRVSEGRAWIVMARDAEEARRLVKVERKGQFVQQTEEVVEEAQAYE